MTGHPPADVLVSTELVRALVSAQHPDLSHLPVEDVAAGWDNALFRLGTELAVRLPRRHQSADIVLIEQRWLPVLAPRLSLAIPVPRRHGLPGCGYPWHWSIVPWFDGQCAERMPFDVDQGRKFATFLRELHHTAPSDAPHNPARGVPLAARATDAEQRFMRLSQRGHSMPDGLLDAWQAALSAAPSASRTWLHADLHPLNVLAHDNCIQAVIDWGDVTAGDPATDLASAWLLFDDRRARRALLEVYSPDQSLLERARGWAVLLGAALLEAGLVNSPRHAQLGADTLRRLVADL